MDTDESLPTSRTVERGSVRDRVFASDDAVAGVCVCGYPHWRHYCFTHRIPVLCTDPAEGNV